MRALIIGCVLLMALPVCAREIEGVNVAETLQGAGGKTLQLNGAGVRTKFFFNIYIAELYMEHPSAVAREVLAADGEKRMVMHFLYSEVGKEKLVDGWNEGFEANCTKTELENLRVRINQFNSFFTDVKKNDIIVLDFVPGQGTAVTIAGKDKGRIKGRDFNDALLKIWLGKEPVTSSLKEKLLDYRK
ncbi:chalcone isomerase [Desulfomarina profundi]|uniref:Chalcone isomerase n=1 Tax=Desulfomarina profundi TaxID=2772557 RepID=A0A8D5FSS5_9BACT|nr:chalcone isomerase family protein [Desulfomarina profundi]BCL62985.1 chalcone isomerase [Desulfomarina profundi]